MKVYLLSFCDSKFTRTLKRLENEAKNMEIFDEIFCLEETSFDENFLSKHGEFIKNNKRGYGYWIWKSYLILKTLKEKIKENDILVYVDGGCTFNKNGINRLKEYFEIISKSKYGILSFELEYKEKMWTKNDLFIELNCNELKDSLHLNATVILMKKCNHVINLFEKVYELVYKNNYHLIDDSPSITKNDNIFVEHRHDQSIMSLVRKKYGTEILKDETWCSNFELDGKTWPIWATRKKY